MEDGFKIVLYVIIGLVYFWFQIQKNKNKQAKPTQTNPDVAPKSLEEMLKDFGMKMEEKQKEVQQPSPVTVRQKKIDNRSQEGNIVVENTQRSIKQLQKNREDVKKNAAIDYELQGVSYAAEEKNPFKEFTVIKKPNYYATLMQNPKTVKDAIVINEIMTRKF